MRNPEAVRPWNYVLDILSGYLMTGIHLSEGDINGEAFNFGPQPESEISVERLVNILWEFWDDHSFEPYRIDGQAHQQSENDYLKLSSDKARAVLGWHPKTDIRDSLATSASWYQSYMKDPTSMQTFTLGMIADYCGSIPAVHAG